jgi:hypothetical protein
MRSHRVKYRRQAIHQQTTAIVDIPSTTKLVRPAEQIKVYPVWTKDTPHTFLQNKDTFSRDLYAMLPLELRSVFKGYVLKMLKPLYGTK